MKAERDFDPAPALPQQGDATGEQAAGSVTGERAAKDRSRAVKAAVVLVGVVNLVVAAVLIGVIPGFRTTLDPVPDQADDRTTPPVAALSRRPAAIPVPSTPPPGVPATATPPHTHPPASATASPTAPASRPATSTSTPTGPGIVRPQGAQVTRTRGPRPRSVRPQAVRPKKKSVVIRRTKDAIASGVPNPATSASTGGQPAVTPPVQQTAQPQDGAFLPGQPAN